MEKLKNISNFWARFDLEDPKSPHQKHKAYFLIQEGEVKGGYLINHEDSVRYSASGFLDIETKKEIIRDALLRLEGRYIKWRNQKAFVEIASYRHLEVSFYSKFFYTLDFQQH